jgi:hypothetical protein
MDIGSHGESYVRYLQTLGLAPLAQWGIRPWGPRELDRTVVPFAAEGSARWFDRAPRWRNGVATQLAPAVLDLSINTTFPFGFNDRAAWRGRGLTLAVEGGGVLRAGPLTVALRPAAFWTQNADFPLMVNGWTDDLRFADPLNPGTIDRPQRFGEGSFARVVGGESTLRLDVGPVAAGFSSASQWWGPMSDWPFLLGNNAEGLVHLFVGSSRPVNVGIGRLHARVIYSGLGQSAYTNITGAAQRRFASGVVVSFTPRDFAQLEVGAARFFHQQWREGGLLQQDLRKPLESFLKRNVRGDEGSVDRSSEDNQLAALFARWVFPRSGVEVYGELGREDHSFDERDLILSPDHQSTLGMGLRKAWLRPDGTVSGLRFEFIDLDPSNLGRNRQQGGKYLHTGTRQGHTVKGQLLGSGFSSDNGAGTTLAWEQIGVAGARQAVSLTRMVVRESHEGDVPGVDVQFVLGGERTRRRGGHLVSYGLHALYELDRYFADDARNLLATVRFAW